VIRYEAGEVILSARIQKLRSALEARGVLFVDGGEMAGAVVPPR
jgi:hypothetical protein